MQVGAAEGKRACDSGMKVTLDGGWNFITWLYVKADGSIFCFDMAECNLNPFVFCQMGFVNWL